jgi:predicted mannosyl-3-phosphoglycerate phosphatase (HAD superfamily)
MSHWELVLIYRKLRNLDNFMENIMADMTGLNTELAALTAQVAASNTHMDELFAALTAALTGTDQPAIDAAAAAIKAEVDNLAAGVARNTKAA